MSKFVILRFAIICFITLSVFGCKNEITYKNEEVEFFQSHPTLRIIPAQFETVTEQVLKKEAHLEGATFETFTEQVLVKDAYNTFDDLADSTVIALLINEEINLVDYVACYNFLLENQIEQKEVPALFTTRTFQRVETEGTGASMPAQYESRSYQKLINPASLTNIDPENRKRRNIVFTIEEDQQIRSFLENQLMLQNLDDCLEGESYFINN